MNQKYVLGEQVHLTATIVVEGIELDPGGLSLTVEQPDGTEVVHEAGAVATPALPIVRVSPGVFYADIPGDSTGKWAYRWVSTGTGAGASEGTYLVTSAVEDESLFFNLPGDTDGIRALLGVTELDVTDDVIRHRPFGPIAEAEVAGQIPDLPAIKDAADIGDPVGVIRWNYAVAAAQYLTAAYIARTMAKGGFAGLLRPEGQRSATEWDAFANSLAETAREYLGQAELEEPISIEDVGMYLIPMVLIASPSGKHAGDRSPWAPV